MSKNKFIKKLLVAGLCALTATAMIGASACNKDNGTDKEEGTGHIHNYATAWSSDENGHWHECLNEGHGDYDKEAHVDSDGNGKCDECDWDMSEDEDDDNNGDDETGGDDENGDDETGGDEVVDKDPVTWGIDEYATAAATVSAEFELKEGMGVYAGKDLVIEKSSGKSLTYKGETVKASAYRVKFNGNGTKTSKYLRVNVEHNATVIVYAWSGTTGSSAYLTMLDDGGTKIAGSTQKVNNGTNAVAWAAVFEVKANTDYYIVSDTTAAVGDEKAANAIFNYVAVDYNFKENLTHHDAQAADCENAGNIEYYSSDYDRYFDANKNLITRDDYVIEAIGHDFEVDYESLTLPTLTTPGSVNVTCGNDASHNFVADLPVLNSPKYDRIDGIEDEANNYVYLYEVPGKGVSINFETAKQEAADVVYNTLYSNDFNGLSGDLPNGSADATSANGVKIYGTTNGTYGEGQKLVYTDGSLKIEDTTAKTTNGFVVLDEAITSGTVKITGTVNLGATGSSWNFLHLISAAPDIQSDLADSNSFVQLRMGSSAAVGVRINNETDYTTTTYTATAGSAIAFEIVLDLDENTVLVKLGGTNIGNGSSVMTFTLADGLGLKGIRIQTADSATNRSILLDDLVISVAE